jgi:hypothetical protein
MREIDEIDKKIALHHQITDTFQIAFIRLLFEIGE